MNIIIVGGGINGLTSAISLRNRGHNVDLLDPGPIPHPLAASTDISKAVRSAYGHDTIYIEMAARALPLWRDWNAQFGQEFYREVGFLFMSSTPLAPGGFEADSLATLSAGGRPLKRVDGARLREHYPAWNADAYCDGFLELEAGYVTSGRVVSQLAVLAKEVGVNIQANSRTAAIDQNGAGSEVILSDGKRLRGDAVVVAVGAWTPYLLPATRPFFRATGHPIFHLKPRQPDIFRPECFPVFGADISTTGYYGFPLNDDGVVKIGNHGGGREMSPESEDRTVSDDEIGAMREFVAGTFPALAQAELVHTRLCMYCDTNDGNFWIARDPERTRLTIATGDSGHGFKFAPLLGDIIADAVEERANPLLEKFRWRPEVKRGEEKEAARALSLE